MRKWNKKLAYAVRFAQFAKEQELAPSILADLVTLACAAFSAGETEANGGRSGDPARERFEKPVRELGYTVTWPGLWPVIRKNGRDFYIPVE